MLLLIFLKVFEITCLLGIYLIWRYPIRRTILDNFRFNLFKLRTELYEIGGNEISYDHCLYKDFQNQLNETIQYAHRLTFPLILITLIIKKFNLSHILGLKESRDFDRRERLDSYLNGEKHDINKDTVDMFRKMDNKLASLTTKFVLFYSCFSIPLVIYVALKGHFKNEPNKRTLTQRGWADIDFNYSEEYDKKWNNKNKLMPTL